MDKIGIFKGELQQDVWLYNFLPNLCELDKKRISLSYGVCPAESYNGLGINYAKFAYIPLLPWRKPSSEELKMLISEEIRSSYSTSIGILQIPENILEPFNKLRFKDAATRDIFYDFANTRLGKFAIQNTEEFVRSLLVKGDEFRTILIFNEPGLNSTAFVPERSHYIGLHVDYLHHQPVHGRDHSANRISINLGKECRYLTYVNLTMKNLIEITGTPNGSFPIDDIVLKFFRQFPKYPVVKVKIKPGEAYIAPTQNIIHDGIGSSTTPDLHLTICGHIGYSGIIKSIRK